MASLSLVTAAAVHALRCPYCGRPMPLDEPGLLAAQSRWGFCGVAAVEGGRTVGLLVLSGAEDDAAVGAGWVQARYARKGLGTRLVQRAAAGLVAQQVPALTALSGRHAGCSAFPREWLTRVGFRRVRPGLWRMDLGQTVVTRWSLRETLGGLVDAVRPVPPPEPVGRSGER